VDKLIAINIQQRPAKKIRRIAIPYRESRNATGEARATHVTTCCDREETQLSRTTRWFSGERKEKAGRNAARLIYPRAVEAAKERNSNSSHRQSEVR